MSGKKRNKKKIRLIVIIEIVCLLLVGGVVAKGISNKVAKNRAEQAATEAAEKQAKEEAARKQEELNAWNMILVNNEHGIDDDFEVNTVEVEDGYVIDERIADALKEMLADCREAGYSPMLISTFRTKETQQYLYDRASDKSAVAKPRHSEHECGLAADIIDADSAGWSDPLVDEQEDMPAQKWLMAHCQDYGFILRYPEDKQDITEIIYEPWHYRYVGKEHAKKIMSSGVCLEEYIEQY